MQILMTIIFSGLSQGNNHKYVLFYGKPPKTTKQTRNRPKNELTKTTLCFQN